MRTLMVCVAVSFSSNTPLTVIRALATLVLALAVPITHLILVSNDSSRRGPCAFLSADERERTLPTGERAHPFNRSGCTTVACQHTPVAQHIATTWLHTTVVCQHTATTWRLIIFMFTAPDRYHHDRL